MAQRWRTVGPPAVVARALPWAVRVLAGPWALIGLVLAVVLVIALAVVRLYHDPTSEAAVESVLTAVALLCGVVVIRGGWRARADLVCRRWFGAALITFAVGQLVSCLLSVSHHPPGLISPGDLIALGAVPLSVAGILTIRRPVVGTHPVVRIVLDSGLLSAAGGLLTWRLLFAPSAAAGLRDAQVVAALALLVEIGLCSATVVTALRDLEPALLMAAGGVLCYLVGGVLQLPGDTVPDLADTIAGRVLWVVSAPLAAWGALRYNPQRRSLDDPAPVAVDPDAQVTIVTTTAALALLLAGVVTMVPRTPLATGSGSDPVSWAVVLVAIGLLGVRELLNNRMRLRLLGRLHEEATSDPLTGLANRRLLTAKLADVSPGDTWCLLALDLDGFKDVNDLLGHTVGDRLLCAVGNRLERNLPRSALVCRIGGDEFAVLLPGRLPDGVAAAEAVLTSVRHSCWDVEGVSRRPVTASVGVATVGGSYLAASAGDGTAFSDLSAASAALQLAKAGGGDRAEVFDGAAALARQRRLAVEERLHAAIRARELDVRFQPVVDLNTGAISGVEALARWVDQRLGTIKPQEFIPVAEQTGLVVALGELVLHRTLDQAAEHRLPERGIRVACNVSPVQLRVPSFPQVVEDALAHYAIPPEQLLVEVTEAVLVEEDGPAVRALRRLADVGVNIAIDDFGTGYSALGYLRRLPATALKIDRSLTMALVDEAEARAITRAVIDLGAGLGVSIIVEGIETSDVAELVTSMGAGYGQGLLYGGALPMSEVVRLSRRPRPTASS